MSIWRFRLVVQLANRLENYFSFWSLPIIQSYDTRTHALFIASSSSVMKLEPRSVFFLPPVKRGDSGRFGVAGGGGAGLFSWEDGSGDCTGAMVDGGIGERPKDGAIERAGVLV